MSTHRPSRAARRTALLGAIAVAAPLVTLISSPAANAGPTTCTFNGMVARCGTYQTAADCESVLTERGGRVEWPTAPGYTAPRVRLECQQIQSQWELVGLLGS